MRFPAEVHPGDAVVSRVSRELSKRMLCVFDVWRVKSLQFQLTTVQRKRKLRDNLFTEEVDTEEQVAKDADTYLDKLYTLLLAYAIAGAATLTGVADLTKEALLGANTVEFVEVPLEVVMAYFFRAKKFAALVHPKQRLAWLQGKDVEERSEWVTRFREGTSSLGSVIQQVMQNRDAHWLVTAQTGGGSDPPSLRWRSQIRWRRPSRWVP